MRSTANSVQIASNLSASAAMRLGSALLLWFFVSSASLAREMTYADEQIIEAGFFGSTKALLAAPEEPAALVLLFPGGDGALGISGSKGLVVFKTMLQGNFLVRARNLFFERDLAILVIDSPSGTPITALQRMSAVGQIKSLVEKAQGMAPQLKGKPVWAVGTSAGTISAAALVGYSPGLLDGAVFTSAVTRGFGGTSAWSDKYPLGIASTDIGSFAKPVLVISHRDDKCYNTPAADADMLTAKFVASPRKKYMVVEGGANPAGDPCEAMSPHGFYDMEKEVVNLIWSFIKEKN